jgi:hypothetical protein
VTTFPALTPSGRTFTPGEYPHTPFDAYSGWQNRVRHSNVMLSSSLRLSFVALTESDMLSILTHYQGQYGTFESFDLSANVWSGVTASDYQLTGYLWRYVEPPTVEDVYCDRYNVELALETVPPDGAEADGAWYVVSASLAAGAVAASSGLSKTITITFAPTGFVVPGFDGTVTASIGAANGIVASVGASFQAGTPNTAVSPNGLTESVTLSLAGGTATGGGATAADESAFWSTWNWQDPEPFLFAEAATDDDAGFAAYLYWTQDLYTDWR